MEYTVHLIRRHPEFISGDTKEVLLQMELCNILYYLILNFKGGSLKINETSAVFLFVEVCFKPFMIHQPCLPPLFIHTAGLKHIDQGAMRGGARETFLNKLTLNLHKYT